MAIGFSAPDDSRKPIRDLSDPDGTSDAARVARLRNSPGARNLRIAPFRPAQAATAGRPVSGSPTASDIRTNTAAAEIQAELITRIDARVAATLDRDSLAATLEPLLRQIAEERKLVMSQSEFEAIRRRIIDELVGFGPLEVLLADPTISDILVNGPRQVYVERGGKLELTPVVFNDNEHLMNVITRIVSRVGRRVDESSPLVDARLPDGSRVNAIIPPLALDGPMLSVRKFLKQAMALEQLAQMGAMSPSMAVVLSIAVRARLNILVSGGTGTGKTTLLNAMSQMIPPSERVVTIEDAAELRLQQPHVGRLETRPPNLEGKGEITVRDLFRNALRMRPDRVIVGEIRGVEALDMMQAMNSGHDGSLGTIHASGPREALTRLENILSMSAGNMSDRAIRSQIAGSLHMIVQLGRMHDGKRRITSITEIVGMEGDVITTQELFAYRSEGEDANGSTIGSFACMGLRPHFTPRAENINLGRELVRAMNLEGAPRSDGRQRG
jgi:pilus assembly protein CpaF